MTNSHLRACSGCSGHVLTHAGTGQQVLCERCWKPVVAVPEYKVGDEVFVYPVGAWRGLSHSPNVVIDISSDGYTVQVVGIPSSRQTVPVGYLARQDMTRYSGMPYR